MREIIFRAKRKDDGKWVYGDLTHVVRITPNGDERCIRVGGYDVDEKTIGQFTGAVDTKGAKIFEGDILQISLFSEGDRATVEWGQCRYGFSIRLVGEPSYPVNKLTLYQIDFIRSLVLGNIHDGI